jgi:dTDP-glucose 4,6-dehydratase
VLVTGAGGFIGSHLVEALLAVGAEVTAMVRYTSRGDVGMLAALPPPLRQQLHIVAADLKDPAAITAAVDGMAVVFHLAALIGIPYSYVHPLDYVQTNITGTAHVLEACRIAKVRRIVQFSTSEVYGTARYVPIDEAHPLQPQSPYAASKVAADALALSYHRSFELPVSIVRPFNAYGPRQSARAVIPAIIGQALAGRVVRLGALTPLRDMTFVTDTVAGVLRAGEADGAVGEVINLGSSREVSIGDLAETIFATLGGGFRIELDAARVRPGGSEVLRLLADSARAHAVLGWRPQVTLEEGIARTIEWTKQNLALLKIDGYHV